MLYLRARWYNPADGRFQSRDPFRAESNLYAYTKSNPVNRIDPTGLFSKETILNNLDAGRFFHTSDTKNHSHWGFYALLRKAEDGDRVSVGYTPLGSGVEIWSNPEPIRAVTCDKLLVGNRLFLSEYYNDFVDKGREPAIWWRDTTPSEYRLYKNSSPPIYVFRDGFDNDMTTYPQFVGVSIGIGFALLGIIGEVGYLVDVHGQKYLSLSGGAGDIEGIGYMEGYLCDWSPSSLLSSMPCNGGIPSASEMQNAISGICGGFELVILTGFNLGTLCKDASLTNWDLTSSVFTYYAGLEVGGGGGWTVTIPLAPFGVPQNPREGWAELINARRQHGMTWAKISAGGLWQ